MLGYNHNQILLLNRNFGNFLVDPNFSTVKLLPSLPVPLLWRGGKEGSRYAQPTLK